jgi:DGQHR domain-containing protein
MSMIAEVAEDMKYDVNPFPTDLPNQIQIIQGPGLLSGTRSVAGFMPAGILVPDSFEIPWYDTRTKKGYQRPPQESRMKQLANDLRKGRADLPTAVLLNIRTKEARSILKGSEIDVATLKASGLKFHVVDGQHRILALDKLMKEDASKWARFVIPFVCLVGADEEEEMNQFYIVNSTAKSVKTDLAYALLKTRAEADPDVYEALQERGREWQVQGQNLVERLATESLLWKHRIRLPSMEKGETTISSASMVASMKPLLNSPFFGGLKPTQQLRVLDAFWHGVREPLREAFDDPTNYSVQKGIGVTVLHTILPHVLEIVRTRGLIATEADSYNGILNDALTKLESENFAGEPVDGVKFWAVADKGGAAGAYSSSAGRRVLIAKIKQWLPEVEVE